MVIRARGPSLPVSAVAAENQLSDPFLQLFDSAGNLIWQNDDWQDSSIDQGGTLHNLASLIPTALQPNQNAEAALRVVLDPGAYTAIVSGVGGTEGVGIVEIFEVNGADASRLKNISTRGSVRTGDNVMIGGVIIAGDTDKTILVRARGPSLDGFVPGFLADPTFTLVDASGTPVGSNDAWQSDPRAGEIPSDLAPTHADDAALLTTVAPGAYTAIVSGVGGTTGIGIVEVFELDAGGTTTPTPNTAAQAIFDAEVSAPVVQARCIACHVEGGQSGNTGLVFVRTTDSDHLMKNLGVFQTFVNNEGARAETVLNKMQGLESHGGAVQFPAGTDEFDAVTRMLCAIVDFDACANAAELFSPVHTSVQNICINCHVSGGIAQGTRLVFQPEADQETHNREQFESLLTSPANADLVISKVQGGSGHGGGTPLPGGSDGFNEVRNFVCALQPDATTCPELALPFWRDVSAAPQERTFRRAALLLAGRAPTEAELEHVRGANNETLRLAIRDLMHGPEFHQFLISGANDRLLTDRYLYESVIDNDNTRYVNFANRLFDLALSDSVTGEDSSREWLRRVSYGVARAPLELIAHVVENDRPYTEILTADYTMMNPYSNFALGGDAVFTDSENVSEFRRGRIHGYFRDGEDKTTYWLEEIGTQVLNPGELATVYPHAGVLNTQVFLRRYPSTATNRNRARSRWTYYHFLGFDIERSAARENDPALLEATDNPTMDNPACTVCHINLDPLAGAFQNYGDDGDYRDQDGGQDSLDRNYTNEGRYRDGPYQEGDTWYRDMRLPGFRGEDVPDADRSLPWLAEQMVADPDFASAAVRFWWPAIMGSEPLVPPENLADAGAEQNLAAANQQELDIRDLAGRFMDNRGSGPYNLRDLLADMMLTRWFTAEQLSESSPAPERRAELAAAGTERLITPEILSRKTRLNTGVAWLNRVDWRAGELLDALHNDYSLYFGGIDSNAVSERIGDITATMLSVAQAHAAEVSCPVVLKEFLRDDGTRRLFNGVGRTLTPDLESSASFLSAAPAGNQSETVSFDASLSAGSKQLRLSYSNDFWDFALGDRNLGVDYMRVLNSAGEEIGSFELEDAAYDDSCAHVRRDGAIQSLIFNHSCNVTLDLDLPAADTVTVEARIFGDQAGPGLPRLDIAVLGDPGNFRATAGSDAIRAKLAELHEIFWGEVVAPDSAAVARSYDFLVETWQSKSEITDRRFPRLRCDWQNDMTFLDDMPIQSDPVERQPGGWLNWSEAAHEYVNSFENEDPNMMLETWSVIVAYFLSDYRYLYM